MAYITKLSCGARGIKADACPLPSQWQHTLIFGGVQLLMSQLPNLESAWWASAIGAMMSVGYATLATALGASQAHNKLGTIVGRPAPPMQKVRRCCRRARRAAA